MSAPPNSQTRQTRTGPAGPLRISGTGQGWPLFGAAATRELEARVLASAPGGTLMPQAGASVARWALALHPHARRISVFCGSGGNGGDGLHAARILKQQGNEVFAFACGDPGRMGPQTLAALQSAQDAGVSIEAERLPEGTELGDLSIDALVGLGPSRPQGRIAEAILRLCASAAPCLAVDLPTGIDADTGAAWDAPAVRAQATLGLLTLKPGHFTAQGRDHSGQLWFDDLRSHDRPDPMASFGDPDAWLAGTPHLLGLGLRRAHAHHKGSFGDVYVIGGATGMGGALRLAAGAALAAGAGRVIAVPLDPQSPRGDPARPEVIWRGVDQIADQPQALADATVVCGCGAGAEAGRVLPWVLSRSARAVLDADALNQIALDSGLAQMLAWRARRGLATILTPHPLEAARMLGWETARVQADRLAAARHLSELTGAVVVLKGSGTVTAHPPSAAMINATGNAALATPGTGDVLAGWMGGWWSQAARVASGGASTSAALAHQVAGASAWIHGRAAEVDAGLDWELDQGVSQDVGPGRAGSAGDASRLAQALRASDLIERMRMVERKLRREAD